MPVPARGPLYPVYVLIFPGSTSSGLFPTPILKSQKSTLRIVLGWMYGRDWWLSFDSNYPIYIILQIIPNEYTRTCSLRLVELKPWQSRTRVSYWG